MRLRGKEIIVHRGETFTLDMSIRNRDGSPFIISKDMKNPHLLLSIASSKYSQSQRYLKNWWISLEHVPKFKLTVPIEIEEFTTTAVPNEYRDADSKPGPYMFTCVINGVRLYKYYDKDNGTFKDYNLRIAQPFANKDTSEWIAQSYTYSLSFIAGEKTIPDSGKPVDEYTDVLTFIEPSTLTVLSDIRGSR